MMITSLWFAGTWLALSVGGGLLLGRVIRNADKDRSL